MSWETYDNSMHSTKYSFFFSVIVLIDAQHVVSGLSNQNYPLIRMRQCVPSWIKQIIACTDAITKQRCALHTCTNIFALWKSGWVTSWNKLNIFEIYFLWHPLYLWAVFYVVSYMHLFSGFTVPSCKERNDGGSVGYDCSVLLVYFNLVSHGPCACWWRASFSSALHILQMGSSSIF